MRIVTTLVHFLFQNMKQWVMISFNTWQWTFIVILPCSTLRKERKVFSFTVMITVLDTVRVSVHPLHHFTNTCIGLQWNRNSMHIMHIRAIQFTSFFAPNVRRLRCSQDMILSLLYKFVYLQINRGVLSVKKIQKLKFHLDLLSTMPGV